MPIYFSWFITALLFGKWWCEQSQPTAKWAPFILRVMAWLHQLRSSFQQTGPTIAMESRRAQITRIRFRAKAKAGNPNGPRQGCWGRLSKVESWYGEVRKVEWRVSNYRRRVPREV